jgi:hypothetical protein
MLQGGAPAVRARQGSARGELRTGTIKDAGLPESYLARVHHRQLIDLARAHGMIP